jgi:hypothetical protein
LWLAGVCLLLLPAFACGKGPAPGEHLDVAGLRHPACVDAVRSLRAQPIHKTVDDSNDDESDDLVGDTWLAPCDIPATAAADARIGGGQPRGRPLESAPGLRSFTAFDPFVPRPPPSSVLL